jgi:hypothetical protein
MIKGPPMPRGSVDFLFWEGPSAAGRFPAAFLITWFLHIHAGQLVIDRHVRDVHCCLVLATDLACIRLSIMVADQQLSEMELKLWVTLDIPVVAALSICTLSLCLTVGDILIS